MIVYGTSVSPFTRKVLFFLGEKGVAYHHVPIRFHDPLAAFNAASPFGKIPALCDGDVLLSDSSAICHYIEREYPANPLMPEGAQDFARTVWFDKFNDTMLVPAIAKVFLNLFVKPRLFKQEPDMAVVEKALAEDIPLVHDYLERTIDGPFLVGDRLTLADIAVGVPFFNAALAGHPVDAARWPRLGAYVAAIQGRPAFKAIHDPKPAAA